MTKCRSLWAAIALCLSGLAYAAPSVDAGNAGCLELQGNLTQGGLVWGKVAPGDRVSLNGEALDVLSDGTTFAGFGRDAPAKALLVVEGDDVCEQTLHIARRKFDIQRVEGVPPATVTPPPEQLERIRREQALVDAAKAQRFMRSDLLQATLAGFQWPALGPISGGTIILDHGFRVSSAFLYMSKVLVTVGQEVNTGDVIGEVGATGRATAPHLDWRTNWRDQRIDPQLLAPPMPKP